MSTDMNIDERRSSSTIHDRILQLSGLDVPDEFVNPQLRSILERCAIELPADVAHRLAPYIWLETNQSEIDSCDLGASFDHLKFLKDKGSVSKSWILFARFLNQPVAIKLTAQPRVENVSSHFLEIERKIYKSFINPIVLCGFSPHVLIYYATLDCESFFALRELDKEVKKLKKELKKEESKFNVNRVSASVVEQVKDGVSMNEFLSNVANDPIYVQELFALLFQVFYTLKVFSELGLSHNDLHAGNIFVVPATTQTRYYKISDVEIYRFTSQFEARIFDFDRASKASTYFEGHTVENFGLSQGGYCQEFGQCNAVNERVEIFPLLVAIHRITQQHSPEINALLSDIAPFELLDRAHKGQQVEGTDYPVTYPVVPGHTFAHAGRLCTCNDQTCASCTVLNDPRINTLDQIFQLDQFRAYLVPEAPDDAFVWKLPSVSSEDAERTWQELHA